LFVWSRHETPSSIYQKHVAKSAHIAASASLSWGRATKLASRDLQLKMNFSFKTQSRNCATKQPARIRLKYQASEMLVWDLSVGGRNKLLPLLIHYKIKTNHMGIYIERKHPTLSLPEIKVR